MTMLEEIRPTTPSDVHHGEAMTTDEFAAGATGLLEEALKLTLRAAEGTLEEANQLLERRAALVARAATLSSEEPTRVALKARQLQQADRDLVNTLWRRHAETFDWLAERSPTAVEAMPRLQALAKRVA